MGNLCGRGPVLALAVRVWKRVLWGRSALGSLLVLGGLSAGLLSSCGPLPRSGESASRSPLDLETGPRGEARREAISSSSETDPDDVFSDPERVLVRVDGQAITRRDFVERSLQRLGKVTLLSDIVRDEIFFQEARRLGLRVDAGEVEERVEEELESMASALGSGDARQGRELLEDLYRRQGMSLEDVRADQRPRIRAQLTVERVVIALRPRDEAALRAYYDENRQYHVRHIYYSFPPFSEDPTAEQRRLKDEARSRAARAVELLRSGQAEWDSLARRESDDAMTRYRGGEIGPITAGTGFDPALKQAIFRLEPGEVSDPVENPIGAYHVFGLSRIVPSASFEEVRPQLERELAEHPPDVREIRQVFDRLRDRAQIQWLPESGAAAR